jgi:hypothetical protein
VSEIAWLQQSCSSDLALELLPVSQSAQPAPAHISPWTRSRAVILGEFVLFGLIFVADYYRWHHLIVISKTLYLFGLAWLSLRLRGQSWRSIGLGLYRSWGYTLAFGALLGIGNECLELFVTQPLLVRSFHRWPDLSDLRPLVGNRGDGIPYFLHGDGRGRGFYCQMPPSWKRATPLVLENGGF